MTDNTNKYVTASLDDIITSKTLADSNQASPHQPYQPQIPQIPQEKKKIILAIPGNNFSSKFLISWTASLNMLWDSGKYDIIVAPGVSSFVTFARMQTLGLDVLRGVNQKPFNYIKFDYWITIDSDIIYTPDHLKQLIESLEYHAVVSGMYRMADVKNYAIVKDWDTDYFSKNGTFEFLTPEGVDKWKKETDLKYMNVNYVGMGFLGVRSEVLYKMTYPYFNSDLQEIVKEDGTILRDICSEDVSFCKNIKKLGYNIIVNTDIRVGHNKELVI